MLFFISVSLVFKVRYLEEKGQLLPPAASERRKEVFFASAADDNKESGWRMTQTNLMHPSSRSSTSCFGQAEAIPLPGLGGGFVGSKSDGRSSSGSGGNGSGGDSLIEEKNTEEAGRPDESGRLSAAAIDAYSQ